MKEGFFVFAVVVVVGGVALGNQWCGGDVWLLVLIIGPPSWLFPSSWGTYC